MLSRETAEAYGLGAVGLAKGLLEVYALPAIRDTRPSTKAWIGLVAGVAAWDIFCPPGETLSEGYDSFMERHKLLALGAVAVTGAHLINAIPKNLDPFTAFGRLP